MIKCKNCIHFKEDKQNNFECKKIWNVTIYDKNFEHECKLYEDVESVFSLYGISGSLLTDAQSYEIAQKFYEYCYLQQDDSLAIGAKAIPLIFNECLKVLASNGTF